MQNIVKKLVISQPIDLYKILSIKVYLTGTNKVLKNFYDAYFMLLNGCPCDSDYYEKKVDEYWASIQSFGKDEIKSLLRELECDLIVLNQVDWY